MISNSESPDFRITMADGQLFKPEKDYTTEVDKQIPEAQELAKVIPGRDRNDFGLTDA